MMKITDKEFTLFSEYIKENYGINLKKEKQTLLIGRLQKLIIELNFNTFTEYYEYLKVDSTGEGAAKLIDRISTNHTYFMREPEHFYYFKDMVLPYFEKRIKNSDLRVWCAASSSGEEPYTLAMILEDYFKNNNLWDKKVLATDISKKVLDIAKEGIYENEKIAPLAMNWKLNYFTKLDKERSKITNQIKKEVIFRRFNLMDEIFPFKKKMHVIFCRNVMIYFDNETKDKLINKFYNLLEDGGYLFIGHSESIDRRNTKFKYVRPSVYQK